MDTFLGLSAGAWTAIFTLGLLVVAILAAGYAHQQWKTSREQTDDARRGDAERLRPYVIVTAEPSGATRKLFDLVIRNIGLRPAVDVDVNLDPEPARAREDARNRLAAAKMLTDPIALIAPGQELRMYYDSHIEREGRDDLPTAHTAHVRYRDTSGNTFDETSVVDLEASRGAAYVDVYTVHDAAKSLHEIQKRLAAASVLDRSGTIDVDAACEPRHEKHERMRQEREAMMREADSLRAQLRPGGGNGATSEDEPPTRT